MPVSPSLLRRQPPPPSSLGPGRAVCATLPPHPTAALCRAGLGSGCLCPVEGPLCVLDISMHGAWSVRFCFETLLSGSSLRV